MRAKVVVRGAAVAAFISFGAALAVGERRANAPFVALALGHVGTSYSDRVSDDTTLKNYQLVSGALPAGLTLDAATGTVKGVPSAASAAKFRVSATTSTGAAVAFRVALPILSSNESEVVRGQSFESLGQFSVTKRSDRFTWKSTFDGASRSAELLIYTPNATGKLPLLVHHRGRGFGHDDYDDLLKRIASWGIVCASISDEQSFYNPRNTSTLEYEYDSNRAELGMYSASASQEAALDRVLELAATSGDALFGRVDNESVFISGHSRGGGATHASHVRSLLLRAKGVIYFMAFDLRAFAECAPPGVAPAYGIPTTLPRLPSLIFSAENDGDLTYPIADELCDRASGPSTFVTVYGGVHNLIGDDNADEGGATITRLQEQTRVANFVIAFIRRWAKDDVSLEGFLYGNEFATSNNVGVSTWRRTSPTLMIDDFQDTAASTNRLGGSNAIVGLRRSEESIYPDSGYDYPRMKLRHSVQSFTSTTSAVRFSLATTAAPSGRDLSAYRVARFRVMQTGSSGYRFGMWLQLKDSAGNATYAKVSQESGASTGYLPAAASGRAHDRFLTVSVPISTLRTFRPAFDFAHVVRADIVFSTPSLSSAPEVAIDDVRFE